MSKKLYLSSPFGMHGQLCTSYWWHFECRDIQSNAGQINLEFDIDSFLDLRFVPVYLVLKRVDFDPADADAESGGYYYLFVSDDEVNEDFEPKTFPVAYVILIAIGALGFVFGLAALIFYCSGSRGQRGTYPKSDPKAKQSADSEFSRNQYPHQFVPSRHQARPADNTHAPRAGMYQAQNLAYRVQNTQPAGPVDLERVPIQMQTVGFRELAKTESTPSLGANGNPNMSSYTTVSDPNVLTSEASHQNPPANVELHEKKGRDSSESGSNEFRVDLESKPK